MLSPRLPWLAISLLIALAACNKGEARPESDSASRAAAERKAAESSATANPNGGGAPAKVDERVTRADLSRVAGDPNATVWVVIVSDFQCPFCKTWHDSTAPQLKKEFVETGKVKLAYVHYPLAQHQGAMPAAEASMCAGAQGKFWELHDKLFETQHDWETEAAPATLFERYAKDLGLDMTAYKACIDGHVMAPMILADRDKSSSAGARSTPTFLVGGQAFSGAQPIETFRAAIAKALQANGR